MDSLIITCAITGAEITKEQLADLPVTPKQQAEAARRAFEAGATIIHLHVREDDWTPSQRVERFKEAISEIKNQCPKVIIQISTGGAVGEPIENRIKPLQLKPEMASLNMGTMNFGDEVFYNHPKDIVKLAQTMQELKIVPELEIYDVGMLETSFRYLKKGILNEPLHCQFVLGVPGGMSGDLKNLLHLKSILDAELGAKASWAVAGIGRSQLPLHAATITLGGHVRVGLEDNIYYKKGELAKSNAQFVERVVRLAADLGRPIATVDEARKIIL